MLLQHRLLLICGSYSGDLRARGFFLYMETQKKYLSLDEQIDLLKKKKLIINNEKNAKIILQDIGYYKLINAYKIPFVEDILRNGNRTYFDGVTIEHLYDLHKFDLALEAITFEATTKIEIKIKALMSDVISSKYGTKIKKYLNNSNFLPDKGGDPDEYTFVKMKKFIKGEIKKQIDNKHPAICWYNEKYVDFPFWVVANILTLGSISKIYSKLHICDQIIIAKYFGLNYSDLGKYLKHVNLVRNVCAHNDVLYRYKAKNNIPQKLIENKYKILGIEKDVVTGRYKQGTNDLLSTIIVFNLLLDKQSFNEFKQKLTSLLKNLNKKIPQKVYDNVIGEMGIVETYKILK